MRVCRSATVSLSDKLIALRTALPDAFDLEETAGKRTAAAAPPSSARARSSLKSPLEISLASVRLKRPLLTNVSQSLAEEVSHLP